VNPALPYRVRAAREDDVAELPALERAANRRFARGQLGSADVLDEAVHRHALRDGWLWVAEGPGERPVGFALAAAQGDLALLAELDVHPDHGRRGLGRALVQTVAAAARSRGCVQLTLTTFAHLPWNAPMYERLGFQRCDWTCLPAGLGAALQAEAEHGLLGRVAMALDLRSPVPEGSA
jgi:GNAT superfamily N-acetyltransferase